MKSQKKFGISFKLSLFFSLLSITLFAIMAIIGYTSQKKSTTDAVLKELSLKVEKAAIDTESWFLQRQQVVDAAAVTYNKNSTFESVTSESVNLNPYLILDKEKALLDFIFIGTEEKEFFLGFDWTPPEGWDPTIRPWYTAAKEKRETIFTEYYIDTNTGDYTISIASPIFDEQKAFRGVVGADI